MTKAVNGSSTNSTKGANSAEDYLDVAIRPLTEFVDVKEVYTHFIPVIKEDGSIGSDLIYRLMSAKLGVNFPSYLVYLPKNGFNPLSREIVVERMTDEELRDLLMVPNSPREPFKRTLIAIAIENDYRLPKREGGEEEPKIRDVWRDIVEDQLRKDDSFIVRRGYQIVDDELRKVLSWNWPQFLDDLMYMGANKDPRIVEAGKTHLMPQFPEMRRKNSICIWMTNPSSGKSVLAENLGKIIVRTTQKSITGGSKADRSVVPSWLMSQRRLITVEMLEAVEIEALLAYMLTSLSGIKSHVVVWQTSQVFDPYCALLVTGNPNREKGQPNFEVFFNYLQGISKNYVALGRRVSVILYGNEYAPCESLKSIESNPHYNNLWIIWREISNRILPLFRQLYLHQMIQEWIHKPDADYEARVKSVFADEVMMIREFFLDHAKNGHPALKYRALSSAVAQQAQELLRVSLGERDMDESLVKTVLEEAKLIYAQLKTINCQSIKQIAETEKLDIKIIMDIQEGLPRYMRELLVTIAHYIPTLEDETEFSIDALGGTFEEIKDELGFYPGISVIKQALSQKRYNPRKHLDRISNFGLSLRRKAGTDIWVVTLRDHRQIEKWLEAVSILSVVSTKYTKTLGESLIEALEDKTEKRRIQDKLPPGVYDEAVKTIKIWFRHPHNRDHEGYAPAEDVHRIISTTVQGDLKAGSDVMRQMVASGILEHHPTTRGLIRLGPGHRRRKE